MAGTRNYEPQAPANEHRGFWSSVRGPPREELCGVSCVHVSMTQHVRRMKPRTKPPAGLRPGDGVPAHERPTSPSDTLVSNCVMSAPPGTYVTVGCVPLGGVRAKSRVGIPKVLYV